MPDEIFTITVELEGIMILSFAHSDTPPPNDDVDIFSRCMILIPQTNDFHTFRISDGYNTRDISGNSRLYVRNEPVTREKRFPTYSINMAKEHINLRYKAGSVFENILEVFDGKFDVMDRLSIAYLRPGSDTNPELREIAESKLISFKVTADELLTFEDESGFVMNWGGRGDIKIKISNICDTWNPYCNSKGDADFDKYYDYFEITDDKLSPLRIRPHIVGPPPVGGMGKLSRDLPCWDVYVDEPPLP